jgi:2',3'-cyclic-nucleotide 2'-phosphodiesterase (5'-nucleotidase family)
MKNLLLLVILCFTAISATDLTLDIIFTNDMHGGIDKADATFMNPNFPQDWVAVLRLRLISSKSANIRKETNGITYSLTVATSFKGDR